MNALTIAGLDPSGGAGLVQDVRTFDRCGVHGAAVVTVTTVQSSRGVRSASPRSAAELARELDALLGDVPIAAAKTGALGTAAIVEVVADRFGRPGAPPLVVDPVMIPTAGAPLADDACVEALRRLLLPVATLCTPNRAELARLAGGPATDEDVLAGCRRLGDLGARAVLAKGGHADGPEAIDWLWTPRDLVSFSSPRRTIPGPAHGLGCLLSAAITAHLARGLELPSAVRSAKEHLDRRLLGATALGEGALWIV